MEHRLNHQRRTLRNLILWISGCAVASMFSCAQQNNERANYFPVDSLLKAQMRILIDAKAKIRKTASLGEVTETNTYSPGDSIANWEKELSILKEMNAINKPTSKGLYLVDKALTDPRSNLKVNVFTAIENLPVQSMRIYYQNEPSNIRKIEAVLTEENTLYTSTKNLSLEFQDINERIVLTGYSVAGMQKMYLKDSVQYNIAVAITLAN